MDSKNLELLLEKYWKCETSLEEEKQLREYFNGNEVSESMKETAALFKYFEGERLRTVSEEVEKHVTKEIRNRREGKLVSMTNIYRMARIAAGILVVVVATYFVRQEIRKSNPASSEITDPQLALEETKKALMMISKGFGKAREGATKINIFNEAEKKISGKDKEEEVPKEQINI